MSLKYKQNLRVVFTAINENDLMAKSMELITNSQDALWNFVNNLQESASVQLGNEQMILNKEQLFAIYEQQDTFFKEEGKGYLRLDLSDIGVLGFIWIMSEKKDFEEKLIEFMGGTMNMTTSMNFDTETVVI